MEIKIEKSLSWYRCDYVKQDGKRCNEHGTLWRAPGRERMFVACISHGRPAQEFLTKMLNSAQQKRGCEVTITGGYDEPKSKLVQIKEIVAPYADEYAGAFKMLLDYLIEIEKERA